MDFGNKEIFGGFYTGDRDLFDTNGAIIDMSGKSDIEIQKLIQDNYFNKKYTGPILKKDIDTQIEEATQPGAATFEERKKLKDQQKESEFISELTNTLISAGVSQADIDKIIPNPAFNDVDSPLYNPDMYNVQMENLNKMRDFYGPIPGFTQGIFKATDTFKTIQKIVPFMLDAPIEGGSTTGFDTSKLPEPVKKFTGEIRDFIETYTPFGTRTTAENIAANFDGYNLPDVLEKYDAETFSKIVSPDKDFKPYPDIDPGYKLDTLSTPVSTITQLTLENVGFGAAFLKFGYNLANRWGDEFTEFMIKKLQNDGFEEFNQTVANQYLANPGKLLDEFFVQQKGYKKGTIFHKMFLEPRLKTGLSIQQNLKNAEELDKISLEIITNQRLLNEAIDAGKPKSVINDLERKINVGLQTQFNLLVQSVPKFVKTEGQALVGAVTFGTYFNETNPLGFGVATGEITGAVITPSISGLGVYAIKGVNNTVASFADLIFDGFQVAPGTNVISPVFGAFGTMKKAEDGLLLMRDPNAKGNPRLNIPEGFRQATSKEVNAYEKLFLGFSKNLTPETRDQVFRELEQAKEKYLQLESFLIKSGKSELEAYDIASRAMNLSFQIPAIQHLTLESTLKLKPSNYKGFSGAVAEHTELYVQSVSLQTELSKLLAEISPLTKAQMGGTNETLNSLFESLTRAQANNSIFIKETEAQFEQIINLKFAQLVGADETLENPDEIILSLKRLENLNETYPDLQFKDFKKLIEITENKINLINTFESNAQKKFDSFAKLMDTPENQQMAKTQSTKYMLKYLKTKKALLTRHWERTFKNPLKNALKDEDIINFAPILKIIDDSFPELQYDGISKKITGTQKLVGLLPNERKIFELYQSLERPAFEALKNNPLFTGYTMSELVTETAKALKKNPDNTSFFDIWKFYNGKEFDGEVVDMPLNLNFEESHNMKGYFNDIINNELAKRGEKNIAPVFFDIRENVELGIREFFDGTSDEIKTLYNNYNSFYRLNIGEVYTAKKNKVPLGSYLTGTGVTGFEKETVFLTGYPQNFFSSKTLNKVDNDDYINKLALLYGVDASYVDSSINANQLYNGRIFVELSEEEAKNAPIEIRQAANSFRFLQEKLEIDFKTTLLANTEIGKLLVNENITNKEILKKIEELAVSDGDFYKLINEFKNNSKVFVRQSDGSVVFKPLVDTDRILSESKLNIEHMYRAYPNMQPMIDKVVKEQYDQIQVIKQQVKKPFDDDMTFLKTYSNAYQSKFGKPLSVKDFYTRYINNPAMLDELKIELTQGGLVQSKLGLPPKENVMSLEAYNKMIKELLYAGLMDEVGAGRTLMTSQIESIQVGTKSEFFINFPERVLHFKNSPPPSKIDRVKEGEGINLALLNSRLTDNAELFKSIIPEDEYKSLVLLTDLLINASGGKAGAKASLEGIANGLSIPSLQSRIYNVYRGIISPQYVFGEASFMQFRKSNQSFITQILTNAEATNNLIKILQSDKPLPEQEFRKYMGVIFADVIAPIMAKHLLLIEDEDEKTKGEKFVEQMKGLFSDD